MIKYNNVKDLFMLEIIYNMLKLILIPLNSKFNKQKIENRIIVKLKYNLINSYYNNKIYQNKDKMIK